MHKIKILKLTETVTNKIEQYYIYKPTNIRSNIILLHTCTSNEMVSIELFLQWSRE